MRALTRYIWITITVSFGLQVQASHIVGGNITYQYIQLDTFLIEMNLYLDCENGIPGAIELDRLVNISYFNSRTNELIANDALPVITETRVEEVNYKCLETQPNACVVEFTFSYKKKLDPGNDGITIAYQRCCRNSTIDNLVDPGRTGATFFTKIPPKTVVANNSCATFDKLPPNFLCTNAPLIFDHKATDIDGDSLVYSIILPYLGADYINNRPVPAGAPPYQKVVMKSPYNVQDMMSGTARLQIDRTSGLLTVTPSKVGQFVMAVLVEEYRDGVKIAEMHRDYQLNVLDCALSVIADFIPSGEKCDSVRLFKNTSIGRSLYYQWKFDNGQTSTLRDAKQEYPKAGIYNVTLIVSNDGCVDSITKQVEVQPRENITTDLKLTPLEGCDSLTVFIVGEYSANTKNEWAMGDDYGYFNDTMLKSYWYKSPGEYVINYKIIDSNSCNITDDTTITILIKEKIKHKVDVELNYLTGCESDGNVNFTTKSTTNLIKWDFGDGIGSENINLTSHKFDKPGSYQLRLNTVDTGKCVLNDSITLDVFIDEFTDISTGINLYNVFTPGVDRFNNCFRVDITDKSCISVQYDIYNRWGELVFQANDESDCWDGTHYRSGVTLPEGEYFGVYHFTKYDDSEFSLSNVIMLKR